VEQQTLDIQHKIAVIWIFMADKRRTSRQPKAVRNHHARGVTGLRRMVNNRPVRLRGVPYIALHGKVVSSVRD
jgi:hypothetical protein